MISLKEIDETYKILTNTYSGANFDDVKRYSTSHKAKVKRSKKTRRGKK